MVNIFIIPWVVTSIIFLIYHVILYFQDKSKYTHENPSFIFSVFLLSFLPIVNTILLIILIVGLTYDLILEGKVTVMGKMWEKYKMNKKYKKEIKRKIKLGIIKINDNDPYGEEDWSI